MENQHRMIAGYRDLTQAEIDLMNEVKAQEAALAALLHRVWDAAKGDGPNNEATRQVAIARTEFEAAFMRLVRGIARPASPWCGQ